jgi:hypothetical protein
MNRKAPILQDRSFLIKFRRQVLPALKYYSLILRNQASAVEVSTN